ncbi:relaxase/mobilization nuclease domain-containing protein [Microbacterium esteraromaticum]|uniref:relaxase/mobilization nuclease domain-containing protein n=1 Tax=Microbacterium esteraromaticum TaxID=57043 RepID=UPI001A8CECCC|nr:relaxase/mobilization nuclease domain-containing protein [Microbacterium esteraromaticum]MBN8423118.1 relaxase/mobilization nuclease domain-containing protein [Microbacterium esteraromaticum]
MAVVVASSTRSVDALINYALEDKPDQRLERYVMASGVGGLLVSVAKQQMRDVRKKWGKDKPGAFVQAYHVIQSFGKDELDPEDPDGWMTAQKLGMTLAEDRFPGRQVLVVTQRDGREGCVHNHLVVNSIETKTGRSLNSAVVTHARLVEAHERVLEERGFTQRADLRQAFSDAKERQERGEPSGLRRARSIADSELREFQRHILWETECEIADEFGAPRTKQPFSLAVLKSSIEGTLADPAVVDWDTFVQVGRSHGVQIEQRGIKGRGISYGMLREEPDGTFAEPSASDRRRCTTLGTEFEMDAVQAAFLRNDATAIAKAEQNEVDLTPKQRMLLALAEASAESDERARQMIAEHRARHPAAIEEHLESMTAPRKGSLPRQSTTDLTVKVVGDESVHIPEVIEEVTPLTDEGSTQAESRRPTNKSGDDAGPSEWKPPALRLRFPELFDANGSPEQDARDYGLG